MTNLTYRPDARQGQLVFPARPPRHNDGTNATIEALRLGIDGARTESKTSAAAIHIGGSVRARREGLRYCPEPFGAHY